MNEAVAAEIRGVSHHYGNRTALNNVSVQLAPGEFVALLGPNGAGKTTLFSILTRLLKPASGHIEIFGHDLARHPGKALANVGVVFQQATLDLDLSIAQNLSYHGAIQGMRPKTVAARSEEELKRFDLWERRHERVRALNGGHRRRVELARALLHEPKLLLLDEASAGLDLKSRTSLYRYVRDLCDTRNLSVLWTTHLVEELDANDRAVLLQAGEVVGEGTLQALVTARGVENPQALVLQLSEQRP